MTQMSLCGSTIRDWGRVAQSGRNGQFCLLRRHELNETDRVMVLFFLLNLCSPSQPPGPFTPKLTETVFCVDWSDRPSNLKVYL